MCSTMFTRRSQGCWFDSSPSFKNQNRKPRKGFEISLHLKIANLSRTRKQTCEQSYKCATIVAYEAYSRQMSCQYNSRVVNYDRKIVNKIGQCNYYNLCRYSWNSAFLWYLATKRVDTNKEFEKNTSMRQQQPVSSKNIKILLFLKWHQNIYIQNASSTTYLGKHLSRICLTGKFR